MQVYFGRNISSPLPSSLFKSQQKNTIKASPLEALSTPTPPECVSSLLLSAPSKTEVFRARKKASIGYIIKAKQGLCS